MECNLVLEKDPDNDTAYLAGKSGQQSRQLCSHTALRYAFGVLLALTCVLLVSNIFLHFKYIHLWNKVERQSQIIEHLQEDNVKKQLDASSKLEPSMKVTKRDYQSGQVPAKHRKDESHQHRNNKNRRKPNRRRKSHKRRDVSRSFQHQLQQIKTNVNANSNKITRIEDLLLKPIVHLEAIGNDNQVHAVYSQSIQDHCTSRKCFTWRDPDDHYRFNFEYIYDTSGIKTLVTGIKVRTSGFYLVYSQIVANGRDNLAMTPEIGYETVKLSSQFNVTAEVLLESYITQDRRGLNYPDGQTYNGRGLRPFDTINHQGIFQLNCGDVIIVRPKGNSQTATYLPHKTKSYFGLTMINYDSRIIQNEDYAC